MSRALLLLCALWSLIAAFGAQAADTPPLEPLLREEAARLERGLDGRMRLLVLRTDDPVLKSYVAAGLMHIPEETYARMENGLAALAVLNGKLNGQTHPVCYILFHPERSHSSQNAFYRPIAEVADARTGAAFLAAHEVGHCLDRLEREMRIKKEMKWPAAKAEYLGLQPYAFARVFGEQMASGAYPNKLNDLYSDVAQRQYEERLADAFAVLWVWRLGGAQAVLDKVTEVRRRDLPKNAHATAPILDEVAKHKNDLATARTLDDVWALARKLQQQVGVDAVLGPGSTVAHNPLAMDIKRMKQEDKQKPTAQQPASKQWQAIPRFGAPPIR